MLVGRAGGHVAAAGGGPTVDTSVITAHLRYKLTGTCVCNVKCDADGDWYESNNTGGFSTSEGSWLTSGTTSEVWIERTLVVGTLTTDPGSGRLATTTDRIYGVSATAVGSKTCTVTFEFWDAASGGNSLGSKTVAISAEAGT